MSSQQSLIFIAQDDVRLPTDVFVEKITKIVADDAFEAELSMAYKHVEAMVPYEAAGLSCAIATAELIKDKCGDPDSSYLASASLNQLSLRADAISSLDIATIKMVMDQAVSVKRLHELIGPITINIDSWEGTEFKELVRADKDGYVQALCLILLWTAGDGQHADPMVAMAQDLTFKFQKLGSGLGLPFFPCKRSGIAVTIRDRRGMLPVLPSPIEVLILRSLHLSCRVES